MPAVMRGRGYHICEVFGMGGGYNRPSLAAGAATGRWAEAGLADQRLGLLLWPARLGLELGLGLLGPTCQHDWGRLAGPGVLWWRGGVGWRGGSGLLPQRAWLMQKGWGCGASLF